MRTIKHCILYIIIQNNLNHYQLYLSLEVHLWLWKRLEWFRYNIPSQDDEKQWFSNNSTWDNSQWRIAQFFSIILTDNYYLLVHIKIEFFLPSTILRNIIPLWLKWKSIHVFCCLNTHKSLFKKFCHDTHKTSALHISLTL